MAAVAADKLCDYQITQTTTVQLGAFDRQFRYLRSCNQPKRVVGAKPKMIPTVIKIST